MMTRQKGSKKQMKQNKPKISVNYGGKEIFRQLTYDELAKRIKGITYRMSRFHVVSYLIGYNGIVTEEDYNNINKLYAENLIY